MIRKSIGLSLRRIAYNYVLIIFVLISFMAAKRSWNFMEWKRGMYRIPLTWMYTI